MSDGPWLVDKSALVRLHHSPDADAWFRRIERGDVLISTPTLLEVGFSARSGGDWVAQVARAPVSLMPVMNATPAVESRALEV
ncbi:MAG: hypothetical protein ACRCY8_05350 [Dermatophilaceae bacterium]